MQTSTFKRIILIAALVSVIFAQFKLPLQHKAVLRDTQTLQEQQKIRRHNLYRKGYHQHKPVQSIVGSDKLMHNIKLLQKHYNIQNQDAVSHKTAGHQQKHHKKHHALRRNNGHLTKGSTDDDSLLHETFKLKPNMYSFSLPMNIGGYDYQMTIDSGSSDIFIKGEKSAGNPRKRYSCGDTCIKNNRKYVLGYLDGFIDTYEKELEVKIGNNVFNESILVAYIVQANFEENQGLVGLSFPQLAMNKKPTFIQTLQNQGIIHEYAFGVNLNFQDDNRSFVTFGAYDKQFFEGEMNFFPLTSRMFYYIDSDGVSFGKDGQVMKIQKALFDTGNTCVSIPVKYQKDILSQFSKGNDNQCYFSVEQHAPIFSILRCKVGKMQAMPSLNIHLDGHKLAIQKEFYLQACDQRPKEMRQKYTEGPGKYLYCDTYIQSVTGMTELFLGDGFFNRYYTYFDLQRNRVGVAPNRQKIPISKIISNALDSDAQNWEEILIKLNPKESKDSIKAEIRQWANTAHIQYDEKSDTSTQYSDTPSNYGDAYTPTPTPTNQDDTTIGKLWGDFMDWWNS